MALNVLKDIIYKVPLGAPYQAGSGTVTLALGQGGQMPPVPFLISLVKQVNYGDDGEIQRTFNVLSQAGDTLAVSIADGYIDDASFNVLDYAECRINAQHINDLNDAVQDLQSSGGLGTVTTSGNPMAGNLTKFSGATEITSGDLTEDDVQDIRWPGDDTGQRECQRRHLPGHYRQCQGSGDQARPTSDTWSTTIRSPWRA